MVEIKPAAPAYAYIVYDLTDKMKRWARHYGLRVTPDGQGFFGINVDANAYIEVISFTKLLNDARKRNSTLFEKLKLDT